MTVSIPAKMRAVVVKEPFVVKVEEVDSPQIQNPNDAIIKTEIAGLCGGYCRRAGVLYSPES